MVCYWLRLALRFWNKLVEKKQWLLHSIFVANVNMAIRGHKSCWAAKIIRALRELGVIPKFAPLMPAEVCNMTVDVDKVISKLHEHIFQSLMTAHQDPRMSPSKGVKCSAYMGWFAHADFNKFHPHITCTNIPTGKHRELMRFRLGCADNAVNTGRFQTQKKARADRTCMCCKSGQAEDELHMVFECSAYDTIRKSHKFEAIFKGILVGDMKTFFCQVDQQPLLADCVRAISLARKRKLAAVGVV
jgi:hypothetical protein